MLSINSGRHPQCFLWVLFYGYHVTLGVSSRSENEHRYENDEQDVANEPQRGLLGFDTKRGFVRTIHSPPETCFQTPTRIAVPGSLTAYAFRTNPKHELTRLGSGLYSAGNALMMFCVMKLFFFRGNRASDIALSCFASLFFSLYLIYDTYRYRFLSFNLSFVQLVGRSIRD